MKNKELFDAFRSIDVNYILDAAPNESRKQNRAVILKKWAPLAACCLILLVTVTALVFPFDNFLPHTISTDPTGTQTTTFDTSQTDASTVSHETTTTSAGPITPIGPPPLSFDSMEALTDFLRDPGNSDVPAYASAASKMADAGGFYAAHHKTASPANQNFSLFPWAKYEDVGIYYFFMDQSARYTVKIYLADQSITNAMDISQNDYPEYLAKRHDAPILSEGAHLSCRSPYTDTVFCRDTGAGEYAFGGFFLDDSYYVQIQVKTSEITSASDIAAFVEGLSFEYIPLA